MFKLKFVSLKIISLFVLLSFQGRAQIINGNFENTLSQPCDWYLTNLNFNALMPNAFGVSPNSQIHIQASGCFVQSFSGGFCLGLTSSSNLGEFDGVSLELQTELIVGQSYTITFYANKNSFSTGDANFRLGTSSTNNSLGSETFVGGNLTVDEWVQHSASFIADAPDSFITIAIEGATNLTWYQFDQFELIINPMVVGCTNPEACNFNPGAGLGDGSCTFPEPNSDCNGDCLIPNVLDDTLISNLWVISQWDNGSNSFYPILPAPLSFAFDSNGDSLLLTNGIEFAPFGSYSWSLCYLTINGTEMTPNGQGGYEAVDSSGNVIFMMEQLNTGCTDALSCNYSSNANQDDGSCIAPSNLFFYDYDYDGVGNDQEIYLCSIEPGYSTLNNDCESLNPLVFPGNNESCNNEIDDNCDGQVDENCALSSLNLSSYSANYTSEACGSNNFTIIANSTLGYTASQLSYVVLYSNQSLILSDDYLPNEYNDSLAFIYYSGAGMSGVTDVSIMVSDPLGNSDTIVFSLELYECDPIIDVDYVSELFCNDTVSILTVSYFFSIPSISQSVASIFSNDQSIVADENITLQSISDTSIFFNGLTYFGKKYVYSVQIDTWDEWVEIEGEMQDGNGYNASFWSEMQVYQDEEEPELKSTQWNIDITLPSGVCDTAIHWSVLSNDNNYFGAESEYVTNDYEGAFFAAINSGVGLNYLGVQGNGAIFNCNNSGVMQHQVTVANGMNFKMYYSVVEDLDASAPTIYQIWFASELDSNIQAETWPYGCVPGITLYNLSNAPRPYFYYLFASNPSSESYSMSTIEEFGDSIGEFLSTHVDQNTGLFELETMSSSIENLIIQLNANLLNSGSYYPIALDNDWDLDENGNVVGIFNGSGISANPIFNGANYIITNFNDYYEFYGNGIPYTFGEIEMGGPDLNGNVFGVYMDDNCTFNYTSSIPNGSSLAVGTTEIEFEVIDLVGNSESETITVNIFSGGSEVCNNVDDDCDTQIDEDLPTQNYYTDIDLDGEGSDQMVALCEPQTGYVLNSLDCDDNNYQINSQATEICGNGIDEDCSGDDLLCPNVGVVPIALASIGNYGVGNQTSLDVAFNAGLDAVESPGPGMDIWYSFIAQHNAIRIALSGIEGVLDDNDLSIYPMPTASGQLLIPIKLEDDVTPQSMGMAMDGGDEILMTDALQLGATYWICVRAKNATVETAKLRLSYLRGSSNDIGPYTNYTNTYSSNCSNFKCSYRYGASYYSYHIWDGLNVSGEAQWNYSTPPATSSVASTVVQLGKLIGANLTSLPIHYTLLIDAHYALRDGFGNIEPVVGVGLIAGSFTMNPESDLFLRNSDQCPTYKKPTIGSIATNRGVCGTQNYQWQFQLTSPTLSIPVQLDGAFGGVRMFNVVNIPGISFDQVYDVSIKAHHISGSTSSYGTATCMRTTAFAGSSMINDESEKTELIFNPIKIYPNPVLYSSCILATQGIKGDVIISIIDIAGRELIKLQGVMGDDGLIELDLTHLHAAGVYQMIIQTENEKHSIRFVKQ